MKWRAACSRYGRVLAGLLLLGLLTLQGARSQYALHIMRIGLQTMQSEVRLSAPQPVWLQTATTKLYNVPAEYVLVFRPLPNGIAVYDAWGRLMTRVNGRVQVVSQVPEQAGLSVPLIRLLGPAIHSEGKSNLLYRGNMELIPSDGELTVVNEVELESYLLGVVSSEMCPWYPLEALKAQAVAARTYALKNIGRFESQGFDLTDTASSQVYGGYCAEDPRSTLAVNETAGIVLTYNGDLIDAVYSSTCGGFTESAEEAWGHAVPYLVSVDDFDAASNPALTHPTSEAEWSGYFKSIRALHCLQPKYARVSAFRWSKLLTRKELEAGLPADLQVGRVERIVPLHRGLSGRITSLRLVGTARSVVIDKELPICKAFGNLQSSAFTVDTYRDDHGVPVVFAFWGAGWGHGLGMCQVGAVGMADEGCTYDKILYFYYHGVCLDRR